MKRAPLCMALALMLFLCVLPTVALAADDDHNGYDDYEEAQLKDFLNQASALGTANGLQLDPGYDPDDPATWGAGIVWSGGYVTDISLSSLDLAGALDVSNFTSLKTLEISNNALTALSVSGCTALESLCCNSNQIGALDVSNFTSLKTLEINNNALTALSVSGCTVLESLCCNSNQIGALDVSSNTALITLELDHNQLTTLPLDNCPNLKRLVCSSNSISSLDISGKASLEEVYCNDNQISSLNITGDTALQRLYCGNNLLTSIDVTVSSNLFALETLGNPVTSIKALLYSGASRVEYKAHGGGYLVLTLIGFTQVATSAPCAGESLINYTESGTDIGIVPFFMFSPGTDYDIIANFTPLTVSFDSNGGSAVPAVDATLYEKIASPGPTLTNYELEGWYKDAALTQKAAFPYTVTEETTLYAKWKAAPRLSSSDDDGKITTNGTVTLTPNLEGGTWSYDETMLSRSGSTFTALKTGSTRVTYTVQGESTYYDLTVNFVLTLTSSDDDGKITAGGTVTFTANIQGGTWNYDETVLSRSGGTFTALKPGSTRVTYTAEGQSTYYDLIVIPVLALTSSDDDTILFIGGRVVLTPNIEGGTWNWDKDYFSATFNSPATFTALKAGTSVITYTAEGQTVSYTVTIEESKLPVTGQNFTPVILLLAVAVVLACTAWFITREMKRKNA